MEFETRNKEVRETLHRLEQSLSDKKHVILKKNFTTLKYLMDSPLYQRLLEVNKSVILLNTLQNCPKEEDFDIEALTGTLKLSTNFTDVAQQSKEVFTLVEQKKEKNDPPNKMPSSSYISQANDSDLSINVETIRQQHKPKRKKDKKSYEDVLEGGVENITLQKHGASPLGISVARWEDDEGKFKGIFVQNILKDSIAERSATLRPGDQILAVNGNEIVPTCTNDQISSWFADPREHTTLRILKKNRSESNEEEKKIEELKAYWRNAMGDRYKIIVSKILKNDSDLGLEIESVKVNGSVTDKNNDGDRKNSPNDEGKFQHIVKEIKDNSAILKDGKVRTDDILLQCNQYSLTYTEKIGTILDNLTTHVCLVFGRLKNKKGKVKKDPQKHHINEIKSNKSNKKPINDDKETQENIIENNSEIFKKQKENLNIQKSDSNKENFSQNNGTKPEEKQKTFDEYFLHSPQQQAIPMFSQPPQLQHHQPKHPKKQHEMMQQHQHQLQQLQQKQNQKQMLMQQKSLGSNEKVTSEADDRLKRNSYSGTSFPNDSTFSQQNTLLLQRPQLTETECLPNQPRSSHSLYDDQPNNNQTTPTQVLSNNLKPSEPPHKTFLSLLTSLNISSFSAIFSEGWSEQVTYSYLNKSDRGLGFSILDIENPKDRRKSAIVIRTVLKDGPADKEGSIQPGDKLCSVEAMDGFYQTLMRKNFMEERCDLEDAVTTLKTLPKGRIRVGVMKPITVDQSKVTEFADNRWNSKKIDMEKEEKHSNQKSDEGFTVFNKNNEENNSATALDNLASMANHPGYDIKRPTIPSQRLVDIYRKPDETIGIFLKFQQEPVEGVYIMDVRKDGVADGKLPKMSRILELNGIDCRSASKRKVVEIINSSPNPVWFLIDTTTNLDPSIKESMVSEKPNEKRPLGDKCNDLDNKIEKVEKTFEEKNESKIEPKRYNVNESSTLNEKVIETLSNDLNHLPNDLGTNTKCNSTGEPIENGDSDDEIALQNEKDPIKRKYGKLTGDIFSIDIELDRPGQELGLILAGNKRVEQMNTYIALVREGGVAFEDGRLEVGDEILELNGHKVHERSHLNVGMIMKNLNTSTINVLFHRHPDNLKKMALNHRSPFLRPLQRERKRSSVGMIAINKLREKHEIENKQEDEKKDEPEKDTSEQSEAQNDTENKIEVGKTEESAKSPSDSKLTTSVIVAEAYTPEPSSQTVIHLPKPQNTLKVPKAQTPVMVDKKEEKTQAPPSSIQKETSAEETCLTVQLNRQDSELGIQIVGGVDTLLGSIVVADINHRGTAYDDGRLRIGDVITKIDNVSVKGLTGKQASDLLMKGNEEVTLEIDRSNPNLLEHEGNHEFITVELTKKIGQGFGLTIIGKHQDSDVYISELMKGWVADVDGRLRPGDQIISINDTEFKGQTAAAEILKSATEKVKIKVKRLKRSNSKSCQPKSFSGKEVIVKKHERPLISLNFDLDDSLLHPIIISQISGKNSIARRFKVGYNLVGLNDIELTREGLHGMLGGYEMMGGERSSVAKKKEACFKKLMKQIHLMEGDLRIYVSRKHRTETDKISTPSSSYKSISIVENSISRSIPFSPIKSERIKTNKELNSVDNSNNFFYQFDLKPLNKEENISVKTKEIAKKDVSDNVISSKYPYKSNQYEEVYLNEKKNLKKSTSSEIFTNDKGYKSVAEKIRMLNEKAKTSPDSSPQKVVNKKEKNPLSLFESSIQTSDVSNSSDNKGYNDSKSFFNKSLDSQDASDNSSATRLPTSMHLIITKSNSSFTTSFNKSSPSTSSTSSSLVSPSRSSLDPSSAEYLREHIKIVILHRDKLQSFGFSVVGGSDSSKGKQPIYVKNVFENGVAWRDGRLRRGDRILKVNAIDLKDATHSQAVDVIESIKGALILTALSHPI